MSSPSPGETTFTPRKEFIKDQVTQPSAFALLALSGANCIRLYSFAPTVIASLNRLFETHHILSFREDSENNLCEFAIDGKPWANPKSVVSEKLLVDIIAILYQCGYAYLSTIDYGREADDRLVLTFSRPAPSNSRTPTPIPPHVPPHQAGSSSSLGLGERPKVRKVPFALSFSSVTLMRVISPPLHLTPAILQAVRGSWPRGVVSEKKVGDNSYEFKLKGYKWFQQDTFATDSLQHILALLTSLDAHSFTLLTSLSLTNRSRVKDLWIFTGPSSTETTEVTLPENSEISIRSSPPAIGSFRDAAPPHLHRRLVTEPSQGTPHSPTFQHARATTENSPRRLPSSQPHLLRKPAPRAQVPVSVIQDSDIPDESPVIRVNLPSTISTGVENMTGIGSHNAFNPYPPFNAEEVGVPSPRPRMGSSEHSRPVLRPVSDRVKTPPLLTSSPPPSPNKASPPNDYLSARPSSEEKGPQIPPLLGLDTFRSSSFSNGSEASCEIPIKWIGPLKEELQLQNQNQNQNQRPGIRRHRLSSSPQVPGGWQPTPISEKSENELTQRTPNEEKVTTPIHEMLSRIESPEIVRPDMPPRKSETALVGIIQSTSVTPPMPQRQNSQRSQPSTGGPNGGRGWVLVNVENPANAVAPHADVTSAQSTESGLAPAAPPPPMQLNSSSGGASRPPPLSLDQGPNPAAKAIVILDAMDSKHKKSMSTSNTKTNGSSSGVKRFFSLNRKNSRKAIKADAEKPRNGSVRSDDSNPAPTSIPRSNFRDRLRLIGTPEASRREGKQRRSID